MANAYRTKCDVTFPKVIATLKREGQEDFHETEGRNYPAGSLVLAENLNPRDRARAESGDLDWALEPVEDEEAGGDEERLGDPEVGVFIPEHEAEAEALKAAGHIVVPEDQALRVLAASARYKAEYQRRAAEEGASDRPVQAYKAQHRHEIPDEVLTGIETRTGHPADTSPPGFNEGVESQDQQQGDEQEQEAGEGTPSPRPRPGS